MGQVTERSLGRQQPSSGATEECKKSNPISVDHLSATDCKCQETYKSHGPWALLLFRVTSAVNQPTIQVKLTSAASTTWMQTSTDLVSLP